MCFFYEIYFELHESEHVCFWCSLGSNWHHDRGFWCFRWGEEALSPWVNHFVFVQGVGLLGSILNHFKMVWFEIFKILKVTRTTWNNWCFLYVWLMPFQGGSVTWSHTRREKQKPFWGVAPQKKLRMEYHRIPHDLISSCNPSRCHGSFLDVAGPPRKLLFRALLSLAEDRSSSSWCPIIPISQYQWPCNRDPIDWRYLPYTRPIFWT